jgi:hypothetical protein
MPDVTDNAEPSLLPGEASASSAADDVEHWLGVYEQLVERLGAHGIRHRRFEERLAYWRRVHAGAAGSPSLRVLPGGGTATPESDPGRSSDTSPRCPFAHRGVDSAASRGCPGFDPVPCFFPTLHTAAPFVGILCRHLRTRQRDRGSYVPACELPGGPPISPKTAREVIEIIEREAARARATE